MDNAGSNPATNAAPRPTSRPTTRLAPSPTGALHLGNARTFLINWALARQLGWKIVLRIEDLDGPRVKPGAIAECQETLHWLGIDWDDGPTIQSHDLGPYEAAMQTLAVRELVYPDATTRGELDEAASAPQEGSRETRFDPARRPTTFPRAFARSGPNEAGPVAQTNWRFAVAPGPVAIDDRVAGLQAIDPAADIGDFIVWTKRDQPAYQLAVVVDDARQGVTHIVRGDDLLASAARQIRLYEALDLSPRPEYFHLPLVRGADGRRLAKRHGDTRVNTYRAMGIVPERLIALLAHWSGIHPDLATAPTAMTAREFASRFRLDKLPREDMVFHQEHDAWLRTR